MAELTWIEGPTRSGKTTQLLRQVMRWVEAAASDRSTGATAEVLLFAANGDNRLALVDRLAQDYPRPVPVRTATPAGFIQQEVTLFWPLLVQQGGLSPQFPMRLRPETEQALATRLWRDRLLEGTLSIAEWTPSQIVRRSLDFLQLAAAAAIPIEDIGPLLGQGMPAGLAPAEVWMQVGCALQDWRHWCLSQGFVTYGIATELYWRQLLPLDTYQQQWRRRFCGLAADDLDEYPAMVGDLLEMAQVMGRPVAVSWHPQGQIRLGVGADPAALLPLRDRCPSPLVLPLPAADSLAYTWAEPVVAGVMDPLGIPEPVPNVTVVTATSRGELLRQTAAAIAAALETSTDLAPSDIAVIGPGFDTLARYSLAEMLRNRAIPVTALNDQRPLVSTPLVRAVLTLLPLVYPGLGQWLDQDAIAEMLVVLSQSPQGQPQDSWMDRVQIDPVRAELIADHCFFPHPERPDLLPVTEFPRWDRLGHRAAAAYGDLCQWIQAQRQAREQRLLSSPVHLIDRAIQHFLWRGNHLPYHQLSALRELLETAQHFWEVEARLRQQQRLGTPPPDDPPASPEARFLQLLWQGTVSANPFPVKPLDPQRGVVLSTVFQYRSQRLTHRWQFWLDAGSARWLTGSDALFGYPLFLRQWPGRPWTVEDMETAHEARLERILRDLLGRTTERVVLCHSDLAVTGQEQTGPLLDWVNSVQSPVAPMTP